LWFSMGPATLELLRRPNCVVVDISDTLSLKLKAVQAYKTQFPPGKQRVFRMIEDLAKLLGTVTGLQAGEVFWSHIPLTVSDLFQAVIR